MRSTQSISGQISSLDVTNLYFMTTPSPTSNSNLEQTYGFDSSLQDKSLHIKDDFSRKHHHQRRNLWFLETLSYVISSTLANKTLARRKSWNDYKSTLKLPVVYDIETYYTPNSRNFGSTVSSSAESIIINTINTAHTLGQFYDSEHISSNKSNYFKNELSTSQLVNWRHPLIFALLSAVCLLTITGNCLVVLAVCTKKYLRNPTGYLIVSLAIADLIVGMIVMPLNSLFEMTRHVWLLGLPMCDLFHALDILASTSSIWNLCVISLDRYMAGHDPIGYRDRVSKRRIIFAIVFVWVVSLCLSFPAIIWWRNSSPHLYIDNKKCLFTDSKLYVVFSSLVSFYIPSILILFSYGRVFLIATRHSKSIKKGIKKVQSRRHKQKTSEIRSYSITDNSTMRIHLGRKSDKSEKEKKGNALLVNDDSIKFCNSHSQADINQNEKVASSPESIQSFLKNCIRKNSFTSLEYTTDHSISTTKKLRDIAISSADSLPQKFIKTETLSEQRATRSPFLTHAKNNMLGNTDTVRKLSVNYALMRRKSSYSSASSAVTCTTCNSRGGSGFFHYGNINNTTVAVSPKGFHTTKNTADNISDVPNNNKNNTLSALLTDAGERLREDMLCDDVSNKDLDDELYQCSVSSNNCHPMMQRGNTSSFNSAGGIRKKAGMREKSRKMMKYVHEQRAARTLSIVVGVFIICWTPFFVLSPVMVLCKTCISDHETFFSIITWAGHLNSMLNPLIYSRFSRDFRKAFKQILTCERERSTKKAIRTPLNLMLAQLASITEVPTSA